jgi:hypothetical protein
MSSVCIKIILSASMVLNATYFAEPEGIMTPNTSCGRTRHAGTYMQWRIRQGCQLNALGEEKDGILLPDKTCSWRICLAKTLRYSNVRRTQSYPSFPCNVSLHSVDHRKPAGIRCDIEAPPQGDVEGAKDRSCKSTCQ